MISPKMLWSLPRFGDEALHLHVVPGGFALSFLRVLGQQAPSGRLPIMMPETEADSIPSGPEKAEIGAASRFVRFCSLSVSLRPSQGLRGAQTGVWPGFGRLAGCLSVMSGDRQDRGLQRRTADKLQDPLYTAVSVRR